MFEFASLGMFSYHVDNCLDHLRIPCIIDECRELIIFINGLRMFTQICLAKFENHVNMFLKKYIMKYICVSFENYTYDFNIPALAKKL